MAHTTSRTELVSLVADEIISGIDHAVEYWMSRLEQELTANGLTAFGRLRAIERLLGEYKDVTGKNQLSCASA
jgi:hypothetical protein